MFDYMFFFQGTNWPLRGAKGSAWEGGVRAPAFMWHPGSLPDAGTVSDVLMHGVYEFVILYTNILYFMNNSAQP